MGKKKKRKIKLSRKRKVTLSVFVIVTVVAWTANAVMFSCEYSFNKMLKLGEEYNDSYYYDMKIPDDVELYFVDDLFVCRKYGFSKIDISGLYRARNEEMYIDSWLNEDFRRVSVRHEVAHYEWDHSLSDEDKSNIKIDWEGTCHGNKQYYECKDPEEYYAVDCQFYYKRNVLGVV